MQFYIAKPALPIVRYFLICLFLFSFKFSHAQKSVSDSSRIILLDSISEGEQKTISRIERRKKASQIKVVGSISNDTFAVELLHINAGEYWTYHVSVQNRNEKWITSYKLGYDLSDIFIDTIKIYSSEDLYLAIKIEKHKAWSSNYEKGKSLNQGVLLLKIIDNTLYLRHFEESIERKGVDYRTGSFNEKRIIQKLSISNENVEFSFPQEGLRKIYKMKGASLELVDYRR